MTGPLITIRPWYQRGIWPLLPIFELRRGDRYTTTEFSFNWLFLNVWSHAAPHVGIEVQLGSEGFWVRLEIPYLFIRFNIVPVPHVLQEWIHKVAWRHAEIRNWYEGE